MSGQGGSCRQSQGSAPRARPVPHPQTTGGNPPGTGTLGRAAGPAPSAGGDPRAIQAGRTHRAGCSAPAARVPMETGRDAPAGSPGRGLPAGLCPAPLGSVRSCRPRPRYLRALRRLRSRPARGGPGPAPLRAPPEQGRLPLLLPLRERQSLISLTQSAPPSLPPTGTDLWFARSGVTRKEISAASRSWILGGNSRTALCAVGEVRYERAPHQNYRFPKAFFVYYS